MSWIRSSKSTALLVLFVLAVAAVGTATAVSVDSTDAPEEAQVGDEITVTVTLTDLYNESDNWTLNGSTQLTSVTGWEVTKIQPNGNENTESFDGQQAFETEIASGDNLEEVELTITGNVPEVENYTYRPRQTFVAGEFNRVVGQNVNQIDSVEVHHYTNESRTARQAIADAESVVNGSDSQDAQSRLQTAIDAFEDSSFDVAQTNAEDARNTAESAEESAQTTQLIIYAVVALVVLGLVGGGIYYWRSQQDDYDKLR